MTLWQLRVFFFLACSCTASPQVTGLLGGRVTLPCKLTADQMNIGRQTSYSDVSVRWIIEERGNRTLVQVTPQGVTYRAQSMGSRISVRQAQFSLGVFSMHLDHVEVQDAGTYYGQVQYGRVKQRCAVLLSIIHVSQSPSGLLPENGSVTLTCSTAGPLVAPPSTRWFYRGVPVHQSSRFSLSAERLRIIGLSQEDRGDWICEQGDVRATHKLKVLGVSGPPSLSVYVALGSPAELPCKLSESSVKSQVSVHWRKMSESGPQHYDGGEELFIYPVRAEHAGTYRCDITYRQHTMSRYVHLKVIQVLRSGPDIVVEGAHLQMSCSVIGSEGGEQYQWTRVPPQSEVRYGQTLVLHPVRMEDAGTWNCLVLGQEKVLGAVQSVLYVQASLTGSQSASSGSHTYVILLSLLVFGVLAVTAVCVVHRRRRLSHLLAQTQRRLSHLLAQTQVSASSLPLPKEV